MHLAQLSFGVFWGHSISNQERKNNGIMERNGKVFERERGKSENEECFKNLKKVEKSKEKKTEKEKKRKRKGKRKGKRKKTDSE